MIKEHPKSCPECKTKGSVTFERFALTNGEYVCDECGWAIDALTEDTLQERRVRKKSG